MRVVGRDQISLIKTRDELGSLAAPWRDLAARARAIPFQWYEWHEAWLSTMANAAHCTPHIAVLRDGDRQLAIMPLAIRRTRQLRLLEWSAADVTDYCDALVDPEIDKEEAVSALWKFIKQSGGYDLARLGNMRHDANAASLLNGNLAQFAERSRYSLPISWRTSSQWLKAQSSKTRQDIGRRMRRLHDDDVTFRLCAAIDPWEPTLEALIEQKRAIHLEKGYTSILDKPGGADFLRKITGVLHDKRVLKLASLRNRSRYTACHLGFSIDNVFYSYLMSYDPALPDNSPGQTLLAQVVMWCCDTRAKEIDFLTGGDDHKTQLGCNQHQVHGLLEARTLLGEAALVAYRFQRKRRSKRTTAPVKAGILAGGAQQLGEVTNVAATTLVSASAMVPPPFANLTF
jgi:CelD/BcsL family acetyltransferase involved in cellulose biosynthesis